MNQLNGPLYWALGLALLLAPCVGEAQAAYECQSDDDCPGTEVCYENKCMSRHERLTRKTNANNMLVPGVMFYIACRVAMPFAVVFALTGQHEWSAFVPTGLSLIGTPLVASAAYWRVRLQDDYYVKKRTRRARDSNGKSLTVPGAVLTGVGAVHLALGVAGGICGALDRYPNFSALYFLFPLALFELSIGIPLLAAGKAWKEKLSGEQAGLGSRRSGVSDLNITPLALPGGAGFALSARF